MAIAKMAKGMLRSRMRGMLTAEMMLGMVGGLLIGGWRREERSWHFEQFSRYAIILERTSEVYEWRWKKEDM